MESRGSRYKLWITLENQPNPWLLKFPRADTGEHWAEKVAAEIGTLIGVKCARVELAQCGNQLATICESFDPDVRWQLVEFDEWGLIDEPSPSPGDTVFSTDIDSIDIDGVVFWPGSEIMGLGIPGYDTSREAQFRQKQHNVDNVITAVKAFIEYYGSGGTKYSAPLLEQLASYTILDGLIGNTDRHHENWMIKQGFSDGDVRFSVAPSYDHATSLGRELSDEQRQRILDSNGVLGYLQRGRGGVFDVEQGERAPAPLALAQLICARWPHYVHSTLQRIEVVHDAEFRNIIERVPSQFMSKLAKKFAYQSITASKAELMRTRS